ncbi:hypothetical protein OHS70_08705 [Streptomyces sp. NBC_00390]
MPLLGDELFAVLEQELVKGAMAHGWPDQTLDPGTDQDLTTSRIQVQWIPLPMVSDGVAWRVADAPHRRGHGVNDVLSSL